MMSYFSKVELNKHLLKNMITMKDNKSFIKKIILKKEIISNMTDNQMKHNVGRGLPSWDAGGYDTCMNSTQCPMTYYNCIVDYNDSYVCGAGGGTGMSCPITCTVISNGCNTLYPECWC